MDVIDDERYCDASLFAVLSQLFDERVDGEKRVRKKDFVTYANQFSAGSLSHWLRRGSIPKMYEPQLISFLREYNRLPECFAPTVAAGRASVPRAAAANAVNQAGQPVEGFAERTALAIQQDKEQLKRKLKQIWRTAKNNGAPKRPIPSSSRGVGGARHPMRRQVVVGPNHPKHSGEAKAPTQQQAVAQQAVAQQAVAQQAAAQQAAAQQAAAQQAAAQHAQVQVVQPMRQGQDTTRTEPQCDPHLFVAEACQKRRRSADRAGADAASASESRHPCPSERQLAPGSFGAAPSDDVVFVKELSVADRQAAARATATAIVDVDAEPSERTAV
eukprot:SAG11_NODE_4090_length_2070_cov_1.987316_1_plen_329_part_10